ncbi:MAG: hypothetical protein FJ012_08685 [Chloroflexi bacterium]|nr:hypothetical protein [Chloroflexota bacterium]
MKKEKQVCPACGCTIVGAGYKQKGVTYCCEPCASSSTSSCECGCHHVVEQPKKEESKRRRS